MNQNMILWVLMNFFVFSTVCLTGVPSYNITWSKKLNVYSAITHCTPQQIFDWTCRICKKVQKPQQLLNIQSILTNVTLFLGYLPSDDKIILSFRGTTNIVNWLEDFTYKLIQYPRCKDCQIHAGFYQTFQSLKYSDFYAIVQRLKIKYPKAGIVMLGSSLGAALATVAAIQVQLIVGSVIQLHAFGSPRVGNQNFVNFVNQKIPQIFRVVHNADIVPHVPLITQNYHHLPYQILFDEEMVNYKICDDSGQDPTCSNSFAPDYSISDHITYWEKPIIQDVCNDPNVQPFLV